MIKCSPESSGFRNNVIFKVLTLPIFAQNTQLENTLIFNNDRTTDPTQVLSGLNKYIKLLIGHLLNQPSK